MLDIISNKHLGYESVQMTMQSNF